MYITRIEVYKSLQIPKCRTTKTPWPCFFVYAERYAVL